MSERLGVAAFRGMRAHGYVTQPGIPLQNAQGLGVSVSNTKISRASVSYPDGSMSH